MTSDPAATTTARPRLEADINGIKTGVIDFAKQAEVTMERALWGLRDQNVDLCTAVIEGDVEFNQRHHQIREMCFHVVLTQAPVARDLRDILGFEHISSELERMADHCVSIARIGRSTADLPARPSYEVLAPLADRCRQQLQDIVIAIDADDAAVARGVAAGDTVIDTLYRQAFSKYVSQMTADGSIAVRATGLVFVAHYLERIADRVCNIAEELIFSETGTLEDLGGN